MRQLETPAGIHAAIIMDGNGRWAQERGLPRVAGHRAGADAVRRVVKASPDLDITSLTLYAFSSDNWRRPRTEVTTLMALLARYLRSEAAELHDCGVRLSIIGRRDRLPGSVLRAIDWAETRTAGGPRLHLRIAVDYSARDAILSAAISAKDGVSRESIAQSLAPDVDLLIRTGGEQRLSDFLLWECAYAELIFTPRMWPDFDGADLRRAVEEFRRRERRFGAVTTGAVPRSDVHPGGVPPEWLPARDANLSARWLR
jgi:undecaprenyl diphosphate synthase